MTRVLVVNTGSSSLKLAVVEEDDSVGHAETVQEWDGETDPIERLARRAHPDVVAHRVVHGGPSSTAATLLDDEVEARIEDAAPLAALHQPRALAAIRAAEQAAPELPAVVCFDTAFHSTLPAAASTYAVPARWRESLGVRRYGFHGLSHSYVARRAGALTGRPVAALRTVSCHLGSGASLCAIDGGRSVDTTMGMTPMEGLVMGTRAGSIDPGILLWLMSEHGMPVKELARDLESHSGLVGLAGTSRMGDLLAGESEAARLAVDVYVHRLAGSIAAMAAATGGLDVLAFTGGIGEHAPRVRSLVADRLGFLGIALSESANAAVGEDDADIAVEGAAVRVLVVHAREDLEIARQTRAVLDRSGDRVP